MRSPDRRILVATIAAILCTPAMAFADPLRIAIDESRLAINGYDPVAYFTMGQPTKGDPRFELNWEDVRWRFATAEHRDMFAREPDCFAPRFGGFCAVGLSRGHLTYPDPELWQIVGGKLFLTYGKQSQATLQADTSGTIERAEKHWQMLGAR